MHKIHTFTYFTYVISMHKVNSLIGYTFFFVSSTRTDERLQQGNANLQGRAITILKTKSSSAAFEIIVFSYRNATTNERSIHPSPGCVLHAVLGSV